MNGINLKITVSQTRDGFDVRCSACDMYGGGARGPSPSLPPLPTGTNLGSEEAGAVVASILRKWAEHEKRVEDAAVRP